MSPLTSEYLKALSAEGLSNDELKAVKPALIKSQTSLAPDERTEAALALPALVEAAAGALASFDLQQNSKTQQQPPLGLSLAGAQPSRALTIAKFSFAAAFSVAFKSPAAKKNPNLVHEALGKTIVKTGAVLGVSLQNLGTLTHVVVSQQTRVALSSSATAPNSALASLVASQTLSGVLTEVSKASATPEIHNAAVQSVVLGSISGQLSALQKPEEKNASWALLTATAVGHVTSISKGAGTTELTNSVMKGSVTAGTSANINPESEANAKALSAKVDEQMQSLNLDNNRRKEVATNTLNSFLKEIVSTVKTVLVAFENKIREFFNGIVPRNRAPVLEPTPDSALTANKENRTAFKAADQDNDKLTFSCVSRADSSPCPAGLGFVNNEMIWTPDLLQVGTLNLIVRLSDGLLYDQKPVRIVVSVPSYGLASVAPSSGSTRGLKSVTLSGIGFSSGINSVTIGSSVCSAVEVQSNTEITCLTSAMPAGRHSIVVQNKLGQSATLADAFTALAPPTLASVSPLAGPIAGGQLVTLSGAEFRTGVEVTFGTEACKNVQIANPEGTLLTCETPAQTAPGSVVLSVKNNDGQSSSESAALNATVEYTYNAAPQISAVLPNRGPVVGGTEVTLVGNGFLALPLVTLGLVECRVTFVSESSLQCTTNASANA